MESAVKKWGNSAVVRIPKLMMKQCKLDVDSPIDIHVEDDRIIIQPVTKKYTLDELLSQCSFEAMKLDDEDKAWLDDKPVGKETL